MPLEWGVTNSGRKKGQEMPNKWNLVICVNGV